MIYEVGEELGYYHWVYIYPHFIREVKLDQREDQLGAEQDLDKDYVKYVVLYDDRERHWNMFFEEN